MKKLRLGSILLGLTVLFTVSSAQALVLTFEDQYAADTSVGSTYLPTNYAGFTWRGLELFTVIGSQGYNGMFAKGTIGAVSLVGRSCILSSATPFDFTGAYFTVSSQYNRRVHVQAKKSNGTIYNYDLMPTPSALQPTWFSFTGDYFKDLVQLSFNAPDDLGQRLIIDNMTFADDSPVETPAQTPVPEPASLMLLGTGFIGMLGLRKLKK